MAIATNTETDLASSNPCFNTAASTTDKDYVQSVKLFLENVERSMFNSPKDFGQGISAIQRLVATQINDPDGYKLTVGLIKKYRNGRLEDISLPDPKPQLH